MDIDDYMEPEVAIAVAVTAAVASPKVRKTLRKGAVYGLAALLKAGDAIKSFSQGLARGARDAASSVGEVAEEVAVAGEEVRHPRKRRVVESNA